MQGGSLDSRVGLGFGAQETGDVLERYSHGPGPWPLQLGTEPGCYLDLKKSKGEV